MKQLLLVFFGGGLGSVLRFWVSGFTKNWWHYHAFPAGTFLVNIIGCFLMGVFSSHFLRHDSPLKWLLMAGFCGGFTTFSTFSFESVTLFQNGNYVVLMLYVFLSLVFGLLAVALGLWVRQSI